MPHSLTWPIVAGLSLVGAASGVYLGQSAVSEIDPAYFRQPEARFHADLVPNRSPDWAKVQVGEYQQAALVTGLGDGCIGCRAYPVDYIPVHDPAVDGYQDGWSASAPQSAPAVEEAPEEPAPDLEREQVVRYASYPITQPADEAEAEAPAEEVYASTE